MDNPYKDDSDSFKASPSEGLGKSFDFHTHRLDTPPGSGIVCLPQDALLHPDRWLDADGHLPHAAEGALYAAGIHPWWTAQFGDMAEQRQQSLERHLDGLRTLLPLPEVVCIGECGYDTLQGDGPDRQPALLDVQDAVFAAHIALSETYEKPLVIHCVRAFDRLLRLHKEHRPRQRWIIHEFRGRPALAQQLLDAGFDLSFGPRRNDESYALTPPDRRHDETDAL